MCWQEKQNNNNKAPHSCVCHRELLILVNRFDHICTIRVPPPFGVIRITRRVEIGTSPLNVQIIVLRDTELLRHEIVLDTRVRLDDVAPRTASVEVDQVGASRNIAGTFANLKHVGAVLEGTTGLVGVQCDT